jgi:hypothetical protein
MIALGARVINNSNMTSEQTSGMILADANDWGGDWWRKEQAMNPSYFFGWCFSGLYSSVCWHVYNPERA